MSFPVLQRLANAPVVCGWRYVHPSMSMAVIGLLPSRSPFRLFEFQPPSFAFQLPSRGAAFCRAIRLLLRTSAREWCRDRSG